MLDLNRIPVLRPKRWQVAGQQPGLVTKPPGRAGLVQRLVAVRLAAVLGDLITQDGS